MWSRTLQSVNEKIGGAEATKLSEDFKELEKKVDTTNELAESIVSKTKEYLQPNPAYRAMLMTKKISKSKNQTYTQPEGHLGECMIKYGTRLDEDALLGKALLETGETMKQLAELKGSLENNVKQSFLEPITHFQNKDLKEVNHRRKEVQTRRLDYDSKRNKLQKQMRGSATGGYTTNEVDLAGERFKQAYILAEEGMQKILENDVEQVTQLHSFAEEIYDYHIKCADVMKLLVEKLYTIKSTAANRPRKSWRSSTPRGLGLPEAQENGAAELNSKRKSVSSNGSSNPSGSAVLPPYSQDLFSFDDEPPPYNGFNAAAAIPATRPMPASRSNSMAQSRQQPCCKALFDFIKESPTDLPFKEGDIITLIKKVDENWYEGTFAGNKGCFPSNYVDVIVPLP